MTVIDTRLLQVKQPREDWMGRFFHSQNMAFAFYTVKAGAWTHDSHSNDEVWNVTNGEFDTAITGVKGVAGPGHAAVIPPDTAHSVKALTNARAIIVDYPRRHSISGVEL